MLLSVGANVMVEDNLKRTPLECAIHNSHSQCCSIILQTGNYEINAKIRSGFTFLHKVINNYVSLGHE
jgi:hypothetical protein